MLDTGIPQSCEIHEYHNHIRYWNSTTIGDSEISYSHEILES